VSTKLVSMTGYVPDYRELRVTPNFLSYL